jgi:hypothetical protein
MDIRNVTQFTSFISSNGFQSLDNGFLQIIQCMNNFQASCNCYKVEDKQRMYAMCCKLYNSAVIHIVPKYKNALLQKIPEGRIAFYYDDGGLIATVSR